MDWLELKEKTAEELQALLAEMRAHLLDLRFRVSTGDFKKVREIRATRKLLAHINTRLVQLKK